MKTKICEICGKTFETTRPNRQFCCSPECSKARASNMLKKKYYSNLEESRKKSRTNAYKYTHKLKKEFFAEYDNKCAICGETDEACLTVGHINGEGSTHRKLVGDSTYTVLKDLKSRGWPKDEVEIECYNCQSRNKIKKQATAGFISEPCLVRRVAVEKLGCKCAICGETDINVLQVTTEEPEYGGRNNKEYYNRRMNRLHAINDGLKTNAILLCSNCNSKRRYKRY